MSRPNLAAIEARARAATPGAMGVGLDGAVVVIESPRDFLTMADVEFYDHAHGDVSALLAYIRQLEAERARLLASLGTGCEES